MSTVIVLWWVWIVLSGTASGLISVLLPCISHTKVGISEWGLELQYTLSHVDVFIDAKWQ